MFERGVHHLSVVSGDRPIGIVSMNDVLALSYTEFSDDPHPRDALLDERCTLDGLMRRNAVTVCDEATVRDAARAMSPGDFHSLPVVNADNALLGIVTSTDLIRYLAAY